jgi:hypothetical protein
MRVTPDTVRAERDRLRDRAEVVVPLINDTRAALGELFETDVDAVSEGAYREEVAVVFTDGDRAVNVTALAMLLRELDVAQDYPGFVVDEQLGRLLAATIAGGQPLATLAEATFHFADTRVDAERGEHGEADSAAGVDDLDAALAAGFQTRLPGWNWTDGESPFSVPFE